ncbi:hypothetical protein KHA80_05750 [Anaerobacillus sp. HL2]|nr:hypothetical protein KHA80_05750 [Anaerobacillus sp. HL2]
MFGTMAGFISHKFCGGYWYGTCPIRYCHSGNAVMVIALFNAAGQIVLGKISDNIGRINTLMLMYGVTALIMLYESFIHCLIIRIFLVSVSLIGFASVDFGFVPISNSRLLRY